MKISAKQWALTLTMMWLLSTSAVAQVAVPNEFQAGNTAKAAEVNANFNSLRDALNDALQRIDQLERETANLRAMNEHVSVVQDPNLANGKERIVFSGVNVQIHNGDTSVSKNGTGNLLIGFGGERDAGEPVCDASVLILSETGCISAGGNWGLSPKSGSHNLVIGEKNAYAGTNAIIAGTNNASVFGTLVIGRENTVTAGGGIVLGGAENVNDGSAALINTDDSRASGSASLSVIAGGQFNTVGGDSSVSSPGGSIFGAYASTANSRGSVVVGGQRNQTTERYSAILGGTVNEANRDSSAILGGTLNITSGFGSALVGGYENLASGNQSAILGGRNQTVTNDAQTIP